MNCPQCKKENPVAASFCQYCGVTLAATNVQGRTVVAPNKGAPFPVPPIDAKTIVQRIQETFGAGQIHVSPVQTLIDNNQREHTVFVEDVSGSMDERYDGRYDKLEAAIRAACSMVLNKAQIDPHDQIAVVTFNSSAHVLLPLLPIHSHKREILQAVQSLRPGGGTDINEGLKAAEGVFDWSRNDVVRRIILLTDGHGGYPLQTAERLKSRGVVIDVRGIGDEPADVDEKLLRAVASVIQGEIHYRFIKDQKMLVADYTQLANKTATS